eukprot:1789394-Rhodomonas_salina.1
MARLAVVVVVVVVVARLVGVGLRWPAHPSASTARASAARHQPSYAPRSGPRLAAQPPSRRPQIGSVPRLGTTLLCAGAPASYLQDPPCYSPLPSTRQRNRS